MASVPAVIAAVISLFLALLLCCSGCRPADGAAQAQGELPALNVIAVDRSGSTEAMREAQKMTLGAAFLAAAKRREEVAIYVVDNRAACVFEARRVKKGEQIPQSVLESLKTPGEARSKRTRPATFWEAMVEEYGVDSAATEERPRPVRVLYLTDGGNDWAGEEARVARAVKALADNENVTVGVLGLNKDLHAPVKAVFAPFGAERSVFTVGGDRDSFARGLEAWRAKGGDQ